MRKLILLSALLLLPLICSFEKSIDSPIPPKPFTAKDFSHLYGMPGFTEKSLSMHFTLYQGYVKTTNAFLEKLQELQQADKVSSLEFAEFKRRLVWDYDGMRLHELYFENLGGQETKIKQDSPLYKQIVADFGSYANWEKDFQATGAMRGIGWVILYRDPRSGRLVNVWIAEHDHGHIAGADPLLVMDVWEHAYLLDYGLDRKAYITAFFNNINWTVVEKRWQ